MAHNVPVAASGCLIARHSALEGLDNRLDPPTLAGSGRFDVRKSRDFLDA